MAGRCSLEIAQLRFQDSQKSLNAMRMFGCYADAKLITGSLESETQPSVLSIRGTLNTMSAIWQFIVSQTRRALNGTEEERGECLDGPRCNRCVPLSIAGVNASAATRAQPVSDLVKNLPDPRLPSVLSTLS